MTDEELDAALIAAHRRGDKKRMAGLFRAAATRAQSDSARAFFLTQAYVLALDCGDTAARELRAALQKMGREP